MNINQPLRACRCDLVSQRSHQQVSLKIEATAPNWEQQCHPSQSCAGGWICIWTVLYRLFHCDPLFWVVVMTLGPLLSLQQLYITVPALFWEYQPAIFIMLWKHRWHLKALCRAVKVIYESVRWRKLHHCKIKSKKWAIKFPKSHSLTHMHPQNTRHYCDRAFKTNWKCSLYQGGVDEC